jgi:hypothetical protein
MALQRLHVLLCRNQNPLCGERIVLPYGSPIGISLYQWYWPTDSEMITLACPNCGLLSVHFRSDVHLVGMPPENPNLPPSVLWRVEFGCAQHNCDLPVVVHTRTEADAPPDEPYLLVRAAKPVACCADGHPLRDAAKERLADVINFRR